MRDQRLGVQLALRNKLQDLSGSGSIWLPLYSATMVTTAFGRAHFQARRNVSSAPAASSTTSAPPWLLLARTNSSA